MRKYSLAILLLVVGLTVGLIAGRTETPQVFASPVHQGLIEYYCTFDQKNDGSIDVNVKNAVICIVLQNFAILENQDEILANQVTILNNQVEILNAVSPPP
jgi:hypothetical protein